VLWRSASGRPATRLTRYDIACGCSIEAAFATFEGRDSREPLAMVFAHVVHRLTRGEDDPYGNPLKVTGAGWAGFMRFADTTSTAVFEDPRDGCRAAAVMMQMPEFAEVQAAYRAEDPVRLAAALEASRLSAAGDLSDLVRDVTAAIPRH
jgi:hypothetical protein